MRVPRNNAVGAQKAQFLAKCAVALWRESPDWEAVCDSADGWFNGQAPDIVRTTHDILRVGTAEELPLTVEIADCDTSPRCRMAKMTAGSKPGDMLALMKVTYSCCSPPPPPPWDARCSCAQNCTTVFICRPWALARKLPNPLADQVPRVALVTRSFSV